MDLEYLIEKAVKQAVSESVKHITINQMVVNDRWVTKKEGFTYFMVLKKHFSKAY